MIVALPGVQVKVTVTFELFHPAAFGRGDTAATIAGGPGAVTVRDVETENPFTATVTVVLPVLTAVARPFEPMFTTVELEEPHATPEVITWVLRSE